MRQPSRPALNRLAVWFSLVGLLPACARSNAPRTDPVRRGPQSADVVFTGQLLNATRGDTVRVSFPARARSTGPDTLVAAPVDAAGAFRLTLRHLWGPVSGQYSGPGGFCLVFLQPGDSLHLTADRHQFAPTVRFTGPGHAANNYLSVVSRRFDANDDSLPEALYSRESPARFQRRVDARHAQQLALLSAKPLPEAFVRTRRLALDIQRAASLLAYVHAAKKRTGQAPPLPPGYWAPLTSLPLATLSYDRGDAALWSATGSLFHEYRYARLLPPSGVLAAHPDTAARVYAHATADFGDTAARDEVVGRLLLGQLYEPANPGAVVAAWSVFRTHNRDSALARELRRELGAALARAPGNPAPAFRLPDAAGKWLALHDLRGQVVYVDFWYSSCAPCLAEAPAARALKQRFAGRDVVFLYVSTDQRADAWQRALARYRLTGPTSRHVRDAQGRTAAAYGVTAYPTYFIIGRDGRLQPGSAPHPAAMEAAATALEAALARTP